ncbi:putative leucine-rich repeat receptor-like protein kinase [Acorus calamus]|uniref:Leucine-rich repeat receptor-like protein kinase n=1 Tax=Acorus calamus TaxID=4465 RepID=A0AAV9EHA0_ACOCL|nr:putative leucine-rich repeat receptor-like protein kinase [Acorus calamus]
MSRQRFISIDCGCNESYVDGTTTIEYKSDDQYISTGETHNISPEEDNQDSWRALRTLRSFPTGVRNCYDVDVDISSGSGKGFISIDCGCNESYVDGTTTIEYKSDDQYISTGETHNISPEEDNQDSWRALRTLRSFPTGVRNCYDIDIDISSGSGKGKGGKYLIRGVFYYGNYDGLNSAPEFDLYVGVKLWGVVQTSDNSTVFELIMVAQTNTVSVCLVNTGKGTPYISAIELRPLSDALYPAATVNTSLTLLWRDNFASATQDSIRYPKDKYDRRWFPISGKASLPPLDTRLTIEGNSGYDVPSVVMDTADSGDMYNLWNNVFKNPILGYHVYLHFMEIQVLKKNQSRLIDIYFNKKIFMTGFQPKYLYTDTIFNNDPLSEFPNAFYNLSTSNGSTLPPLLNAAELYAAVNWAINASTFGQDGMPENSL